MIRSKEAHFFKAIRHHLGCLVDGEKIKNFICKIANEAVKGFDFGLKLGEENQSILETNFAFFTVLSLNLAYTGAYFIRLMLHAKSQPYPEPRSSERQ